MITKKEGGSSDEGASPSFLVFTIRIELVKTIEKLEIRKCKLAICVIIVSIMNDELLYLIVTILYNIAKQDKRGSE